MAKKKILVVDDSRHIAKAVKTLLEAEKFEVITAQNAREGLSKMKKEKPNLILLDILMPANGVDALKLMLKINPKARVAMLTVMGQERVIKECKELGAVDYITKPFDNKELVRRVKRLVG
jgi:two-component system chemotaxis response regulator CheY